MPPAPGERTPNAAGMTGAAMVGGGEVMLELTVGKDGRVSNVDRLRVTAPYTDLLATAVQGWRFIPAESSANRERRTPVESHVLVAALHRQPSIYLGTSVGDVPRDLARPSNLVPVPHELISAPFPVTARGGGVVLLEVDVGANGATRNVRVIRSAGIFDSAAIQAVERWTFSPARTLDGAVPSFAYVVMGFLEPIVAGRGR